MIGIDPNEAMLAQARATGGPSCVRGKAEATGLKDASVDLVTAGQAFHWFERDASLRKIRRILSPVGFCAAFWNARESAATPFMAAYEDLLREHVPTYDAVASARGAAWLVKDAPGVASVREAAFPNGQLLDRDGFLGRVYSASYVRHDIAAERRADFDRALGAVFDRYQEGGRVELVYRTEALSFQPR